ncbi:hypothetical protein ACFWGL_00080 [Streptomyces sp. NPDC060286]|uniref:hypothetical protein n=1 Tax=unclassified Streptomyces TaxID=2593676 RepID=UPI0035E01325
MLHTTSEENSMFGKKTFPNYMTPEEAEAALQAVAEENDRRRAEQSMWVTCVRGHAQYSGRTGCHVPGCPG